jgi:UDP-N-acetylglucosamine--N-acetylmuramyl-(pentapeptide) pyrophosphoryl-undecaprenol N-acetylglucosamine transferase
MKIVVACGGSGGHTFPGLATARELSAQGHEVTLWLAGQQIENTVASVWNGPVQTIPAQGFSGNPVRKVIAFFKMCRAIWRCFRLLGQERPDRLLAMGSYSSIGPVVAAWFRRIPVVLHESNAIPGLATIVLSHLAQAIAVNFDSCRHHLSHPNMVVTGIPLRAGFETLPPAASPKNASGLTLLAMGGSQGAHRVNEAVRDAVLALHRKGMPIFIIHLAGRQDADSLAAAYAQAGVPHEVHAFFQDMPHLFGRSDLVISRAGATSCAELLACGLPSLLIPYPEAARDHQSANARAVTEAGAADWIPQAQATPERLAEFIETLAHQPERYAALREAARRLAIHDGATRLASLVARLNG